MPGRVATRIERLVRRGLGTPLRGPLRIGYDSLVAAEIAVGALLASRHRRPAYAGGDVTVVAKTFERPRILGRFLAGLPRVFAGPVLIADDSRNPVRITDPQVTVFTMPFDSGIGPGRNLLLSHVQTEFVLMCDDDFILLPDFDIARAVGYLQRHNEVDVYAGRVINLPQLSNVDYSRQALLGQPGTPKLRQGTLIEGLPVLYKVPNFYLARTASIRGVGYDQRLKRVDHNDFFSSAFGRLVCVQDRGWTCLHAHTIFDQHYQSFRLDMDEDFAYLARKWARGGPSGFAGAGVDLTAEQRATLHAAAIACLGRDIGLAVTRLEAPPGDELRIGTTQPEQLAEALIRIGWARRPGALEHPLWGRVVLAVASPELPPSQPDSDAGPTRIVRSARAAWIDDDDVLIGASLPGGPVLALESPADLLWEVLGEHGAPRDEVVDRVLAHFENPPAEAREQIEATLDQLLRAGLFDAVGAETDAAEGAG
ncbi:MAG: glycosyltransferase [Micropruina sp.]|nr:glycosyltransferase [Micropruina sp.]